VIKKKSDELEVSRSIVTTAFGNPENDASLSNDFYHEFVAAWRITCLCLDVQVCPYVWLAFLSCAISCMYHVHPPVLFHFETYQTPTTLAGLRKNCLCGCFYDLQRIYGECGAEEENSRLLAKR
jgi:hypothetical protein